MDKVKPLHHIRYGNVEASIWENITQGGGAFYNVTFAKHYKDGDEWKTSQSFGMGDLLELSKVADHAHTWISNSSEANSANQSPFLRLTAPMFFKPRGGTLAIR